MQPHLHHFWEWFFFWWGGGGLLGYIWAGYVPLASQSPYPIIVYSVTNYRPDVSHFSANMSFSRSQLSHLPLLWIDPFFKLNEEHFTFHLLLAVNMKNCLTPKNLKTCDPILVTVLKMRPHYSHFSHENATPSNGTTPLASYKEVPPPPHGCLHAKHSRLVLLF